MAQTKIKCGQCYLFSSCYSGLKPYMTKEEIAKYKDTDATTCSAYMPKKQYNRMIDRRDNKDFKDTML